MTTKCSDINGWCPGDKACMFTSPHKTDYTSRSPSPAERLGQLFEDNGWELFYEGRKRNEIDGVISDVIGRIWLRD